MPTPPQTLNKVILLLVSGLAEESVIEACVEKFGMSETDARAAYRAARRRVALAAQYHPDEELGRAITRLNDLYARSLKIQDTKTALSVQRELDRLLDLGRLPAAGADGAAGDAAGALAEVAAARAHLAPLGLGRPADGLAELARLAVGRIVELGGRRNPS